MSDNNWANYSGRAIREDQVAIPPSNRAFCYGDSLFETIIAQQGTIPLWPYHWSRLTRGMEALGYQAFLEEPWSSAYLKSHVMELLDLNGLTQSRARIKIQVWRETGGKYTPSSQGFQYLITAQQSPSPTPKSLNAGISESVQLQYTPWSEFKTGSALPYIQAGRERTAHGWDEIILLNTDGHIAEAGASNLFWIKSGIIYTPAITTGCLGGVTRAALLDFFQKNAKSLSIGHFPLSELLQATHIFTTNVAGLHHICRIGTQRFQPWKELPDLLGGMATSH